VRFDPEAPEGARIRVWDRVREDLVERVVTGDRAPCVTLGVDWCVRQIEPDVAGLRLVDGEGRLVEVPEERAEARVRALEEELAKRG